jgi:hypothetical protein
MIAIHDFEFLVGSWTVKNRRLKKRLNNCQEWVEFTGFMETKKMLNGFALTDEMRTNYLGEEFIGLSFRIFNPYTSVWTIYWADTINLDRGLTEQVIGKFKDGIGVFYGKEMHDEVLMDLRFLWKKDKPDTARWEQAYLDKRTNDWETNWTMDFTRVDDRA